MVTKRDKLSFSLALILNIVIVLLMPEYKIEDVKDKKLKVGLVALEKEKTSSKEKKKTVSVKKQTDKKDREEKKKEIPVSKKEEVKKQKSLSLESVSKTIKSPVMNVMSTVNPNSREKKVILQRMQFML